MSTWRWTARATRTSPGRVTSSTIQTRRRAADGTLNSIQSLGGPGLEPQVAVDSAGNAEFVWRPLGSGQPVQARERSANGALGAVQDLSAPTAGNHSLAASADGTFAAAWVEAASGGGTVVRGAIANTPPVVFVHGFLASRLRCQTGSGFDELWPSIPSPQLPAMELASNGVSDAGDGTCVGPVEPAGVVETAAGQPVHDTTLQFLDRIAPGKRYVYAWDWRKSPEQSLAGLDALVDQAQAEHNDRKVAILAHSFGGLLTRWYIDVPARADKVERALIVGTPSWGAPKAVFPLATGQEEPSGLVGLDVFLDNDELKSFAQNLAGAFFLYPSSNYGAWLTVQGHVPPNLTNQQDLIDYVNDDLLGNGPLLADALDDHANVLDGWQTNGVDVRALVGTGLNTVQSIEFVPGGGGFVAPDSAELLFGNGDSTVPARSAVQGPPGTANPLGEDIPIGYACAVSHVPLAGDVALTAAGADDFLAHGEALLASNQPCNNGGFSIQLFNVDLTPAASLGTSGAEQAEPRSATARSTLTGAEAAGSIDLIPFPGVDFAITDDSAPVSLEIPGASAHVVVRRLDGDTQGPPQTFGPFPTGIQLNTGAGGTIQVGAIAPPGTAVPSAPGPTKKKCKKGRKLKKGKCVKKKRKKK